MIDHNLKSANILIVDDQQANIDVLAGFLEMEGYGNIMSTTDPRRVVSMFVGFEPDLILLDLMMPHLSGYDVMHQLRPLIPVGTYFPILILTADITVEAKKQALSAGARDFLVKPFDLVEVGLRIRNLLETRYLHQEQEHRNRILDEKVKERTHELEETNRELMVARDRAEESNRLKSAFMQNISHEVRTPLNGLLGFAALMADAEVPAEAKAGFLPMMQASANRLVNTITDYMDISLIASGTLRVSRDYVHIQPELTNVRDKFMAQCEARKLDFFLEMPEDGAGHVIATDPELLSNVINHLVDNAIKFTKQGSVTLGYRTLPNGFEFYVKDTGVGIADEAKERIFEVFMQEDVSHTRGHEGSGLGLSVIRGFLQLLKGEITLESVKGKGSQFSFTLPSDGEKDGLAKGVTTNYTRYYDKKPVVLIVDDERSNLVYLEMILQKKVPDLFMASNGKEAVDLCRRNPHINFVLMDIKMPVMNGFEATKEIKSFRNDLPVIAITAYAMAGDEQKIHEAGCDGYLAKPFSKEKLYTTLQQFGLEFQEE